MSEEYDYYSDLIEKGYSDEKALEYTKKYFPEFDGSLPEPAPPPSFSQEKEEKKLTIIQQIKQIDVADVLADGYLFFESSKVKILENKKTTITVSAIFVVFLLLTLAFRIPTQMGPLEGEWMKSDGEIIQFERDGTYLDNSDYESNWDLTRTELEITSVGEIQNADGEIIPHVITQYAQIDISNDRDAVWIKWTSLIVHGEPATPPDGCFLIISTKIAIDYPSYVEQSTKYQAPSFCD